MAGRNTEVAVSGNGASGVIDRSSFLGRYVLYVVAGTWGGSTSVQLEVSPDGTNWVEHGTAATENAQFELPGNAQYRVNVTTFSGTSGMKLICREFEKGC